MNLISDLSGSKSVLESRLEKIKEINNKLPQSEAVLDSLNKYVTEKAESLPVRAKEAMNRDLNNLR